MITIKNATIITFGDEGKVIEDGKIVIDQGVIKEVGHDDKIYGEGDIIDAKGRVVTPGLVNAHMHFYSAPACGLDFRPAGDFKGILENLWWRLDKAMDLDDVEAAAYVLGLRSLLHGVTTVFDHHASYGAIRGSLGKIHNVVKTLGLKTALAFEVSDRAGEIPANAAIDENVDAFLRYKDDPDIVVMMGLHASFTLDTPTLSKAVKKAKDAGMGLHIHAAEGIEDVEDAKWKGFAGVISRLYATEVLGRDTIAAHCIHITDDEIELLRRTGTWVVSNPTSNLNNGVGIARVRWMAVKDLYVGLGTDGMGGGMLTELRNLIFSQHHLMSHPTAYFADGIKALTEVNPALATHFFGRDIGVIKEGAVADVVIWDYWPSTPITSENMGGHIAFGLWESRPDYVIANGDVVVKGGQPVCCDMANIAAMARERFSKLWERW